MSYTLFAFNYHQSMRSTVERERVHPYITRHIRIITERETGRFELQVLIAINVISRLLIAWRFVTTSQRMFDSRRNLVYYILLQYLILSNWQRDHIAGISRDSVVETGSNVNLFFLPPISPYRLYVPSNQYLSQSLEIKTVICFFLLQFDKRS